MIARLEAQCPGAYRTYPWPGCEPSQYHQTFLGQSDEATEQRRGRELAELLRRGTAPQRAQATAILVHNSCLLTGSCGQRGNIQNPARSICRNPEIAKMLFEALERDVGAASELDPRNLLTLLVERVLSCLDLEKLGLVERFRAVATKHDALSSPYASLRPQHAVRIAAALRNPSSKLLWDIAFAELDAEPAVVPYAHAWRLATTKLPPDVAARVCPHYAASLAAAPGGIGEMYGMFATSDRAACFGYREPWLAALEKAAAARPLFGFQYAIGSLGDLCANTEVTSVEAKRAAKVLRAFATARPADASVETRSSALHVLCGCDDIIAAPVAKAALKSEEPAMRLVAEHAVCAEAVRWK